ncbi:MAG: hypothetical protein SNH88_01130 [Rikenellaceae bacterium]
MKTNKLLNAFAYLCAAVVFVGCTISDKAVSVQAVEDLMETTTIYYVSGDVLNLDGKVDLADVSVAVDGTSAFTGEDGSFLLELSKTGTYDLSFEKSGFTTVAASITIASDASNRSVLSAGTVVMSPVAVAKTITAEDLPADATEYTLSDQLSEENTSSSIVIPVDYVKTLTGGEELTMTVASAAPVVELASDENTAVSAASAVSVPFVSVSVESTVDDFGVYSLAVTASNPFSSDYSFDTVTVEESTESALTKASTPTATFVKSSNSYNYSTSILKSSYDFVIAPLVATTLVSTTTTSGNTVNGSSEYVCYNEGNSSAKTGIELEVVTQIGWTYVDAIATVVKSAFPSISDVDCASLTTSIGDIIVSREGKNGVKTITTYSTINVSGDTNYYYRVNAEYCVKSYIFAINGTDVTVQIKNYYGSNTVAYAEQGDSHSGGGTHSGGSIN